MAQMVKLDHIKRDFCKPLMFTMTLASLSCAEVTLDLKHSVCCI